MPFASKPTKRIGFGRTGNWLSERVPILSTCESVIGNRCKRQLSLGIADIIS